MYDIEHCRCGELGTHWEVCNTCNHIKKGYSSCRNRHCPGCNNIPRKKWVAARIADLLAQTQTSGIEKLNLSFKYLSKVFETLSS